MCNTSEALAELLSLRCKITTNGARVYLNDRDEYHRIHGPAIVYTDGGESWYQNGQLHRDHGPAIVHTDGQVLWYQRGRLHRTDGPSIIASGGNHYHLYGAPVSRTAVRLHRVASFLGKWICKLQMKN